MSDTDANKEALEHVERATESNPVSGEELLESEELKRQLRKAKSAEANSTRDGREDRKN